MCLQEIYWLDKQNETLKEIPGSGLEVYKVVVKKDDGKYYPLFGKIYDKLEPYQEGLNEADTSVQIIIAGNAKYMSGFHFWTSLKVANETRNYMDRLKRICHLNSLVPKGELHVITCLIKKEWITIIGRDEAIDNRPTEEVMVAKQAVFPIG
jgi:hypothetical protein